MTLSRSSGNLKQGLDRLADPDDFLLDVATEASLRGLNLPYDMEIAIQNPRNREAIARALRAVAKELHAGGQA